MHDRTDLLTNKMLIAGEWLSDGSAGHLEHVNPSTGVAQQRVPIAGPDQVDAAVRAAREALPQWRDWMPERRREALQKLAALLREDNDAMSIIGALEGGTPVSTNHVMFDSIFPAWFEYYAGWVDKLTGDTIPIAPGRALDLTTYEPVGVVASILTWNSPMGGLAMSVAPALAAGCTVVIKPPELSPFSTFRFGELCQRAGIPAGVVNIVPGDGNTGDALVRHPDIDKITFTGGSATARRIQASAAETLTPAIFELGGKSASLIFADADLDRAAAHAAIILLYSGQGCSHPTRLLVEKSIEPAVTERMVAIFESVRVGDPFSADVAMGPVISAGACDRILGMVDRAQSEGAKVATGGVRLAGDLSDGYFLPPTLLTGVDRAQEVALHEVFGPVSSILTFESEQEALDIANSTSYGLAGYVHTANIDRALRLATQLEAGNVGINGGTAPASYAAPFGGVKDSGSGREGGREGIMEFIRVKNVHIDIASL